MAASNVLVEGFVDGLFVDNATRPGTGARISLEDPSTGECFGEVTAASPQDVPAVVASSRTAFPRWRDETPLHRGQLSHRIAAALSDGAEELVELLVRDAGLPLALARRDVEVAARYFEYYAGFADKLFGETIPLGPHLVDFSVREPWGVCAVILPFNFPLQLMARSVAPALVAGNAVIVKPAEQAPLAPLRLAAICRDIGLPAGALNVVVGDGSVGAAIVAGAETDHITFTGSLATGRVVLRAAAEALKPVILELGGKSPHIVFADADLDAVVRAVVGTTWKTAGQACSAGTRVLVQREILAQLSDLLRGAAARLSVGPAALGPDVGPLISAKQQATVMESIRVAAEEGSDVLCGGPDRTNGLPRRGYFVPPTLIVAANGRSRSAREEIFGPVVTLVPFDGEPDAVRLANDSEYALVAGVWTAQVSRALRVARLVRAGQVFINNYGVGGGVELPFGGRGLSGYGRLKGLQGVLAYTEVKNVCIAVDPG